MHKTATAVAPAGVYAQVDFGDFKYYDGAGVNREGHELVVSFPNSNAGWTQVFPAENQECLLEGLKIIFYIGGVPLRLRCDNMSTANEEFLRRCDEDHKREHYERGTPIAELWKEEKRHLLALPEHEYEVFRYESLKANKYGFVKIDTAKYGLSPELARKVVQAKIYFDKIEVYYDRSLLKSFRRSYERNGEDTDWKDYLPTLVKKPGTTEHTRFFNQMPKLWGSI